MKKIVLVILALLLVGCNSKKKEMDESMKHYEASWKAVLNESKFKSSSRFFDIKTEMYKDEVGYSYYIEINNPKIAMYGIEVMVVENKEAFNAEEKMLPSLGIFDNPINLVPFQVDKDKGFLEGILLGREELETPSVTLQLMITWTNNTSLESYKELIELEIEYIESDVEDTLEVEETP